ncbi:MAG: BON domain-containing protein [Candidatus Zixiibacteriota bacterium]
MNFKKMFSSAVVTALALLAISAPLRAADMDGRIEATAKRSFVFQTYLRGDAVNVKSMDGVVTLSGTVANADHRSMAEEMVRSIEEVKNVINQLDINGPAPVVNSDTWVSERVRSTLLMHRSVSYANTDVTVKDGKVTLRGEASSVAQKMLTAEYVKDVAGVKDVDNKMTVREAASAPHQTAAEIIDDASITTQIKMSLLFHHGSDAFDTKVSTTAGVVTLTGTAKNQAEIDLATKRVNDIYGVKSVNNKMTIEVSRSSTN